MCSFLSVIYEVILFFKQQVDRGLHVNKIKIGFPIGFPHYPPPPLVTLPPCSFPLVLPHFPLLFRINEGLYWQGGAPALSLAARLSPEQIILTFYKIKISCI